MVQKQSWLNLTDSSSVLWLKVFHIYGGFFRRYLGIGYYVKGSIRVIKPQLGFYKGFTIKKIKKGFIRRSLFLRSAYPNILTPLTTIFNTNSSCVIKKKNIILSAHILGPVLRTIRNKRILQLFKFII